MPNNDPLVSIKIASYNHARFIGQTIRSVLEQDYRDFELIIIDDCSQDDSVEIIRSFDDPRITLLINEYNIGTAASSKKAGKLCRGKYFCSLDSDDYFHPHKLSEQVVYMESRPEMDAVITYVQEVDEKSDFITGSLSSDSEWFNRDLDFNHVESWLWENHVCHSSVLMKRSVHDKLWDYDCGLRYTNDWSNWIRFLVGGVSFGVLPKKLTFYRRHAENVSKKNPVRAYWEYAYVSASLLHPYLEKIGRRDLVANNLRRFFNDPRYPGSAAEKNNFLRLLLGLSAVGKNFETIWFGRFDENGASSESATGNGLLLMESMRQELVDSQVCMDSMRRELRYAENRAFRVARLRDILFQEEFSLKKYAKAGYVAVCAVVPDIARWLLRPFIQLTWRWLRDSGRVTAYRVQAQPVYGKRRRVLHVIANFMMGGSSQLVVDIVEALGSMYQQKILTAFVPFPVAYSGVPVYSCRSQYEMRAFLSKFQPDLIHVHYWGDSDWAWYDKIFRIVEEAGCKVIENVNTPVVPYRSPIVRRYVYVSNYVMRNFGRLGEAAEVVYPGSDIGLYSRKQLDTVPDDCVGMVYRLEADKLNMQSIDVFIRVVKRRPRTKILIVGGGSFLRPYQQAVLAHGVEDAFRFTGTVPYTKLPELYAKMSVFVAPVWKESFGQVSVFAMAMGIPVTGYRVGGLEDIIDDSKLLATPGNSGELADIIVDLLENRKKRLEIGVSNRRRAESLFTVENMTRRYEELYRNVIDIDV